MNMEALIAELDQNEPLVIGFDYFKGVRTMDEETIRRINHSGPRTICCEHTCEKEHEVGINTLISHTDAILAGDLHCMICNVSMDSAFLANDSDEHEEILDTYNSDIILAAAKRGIETISRLCNKDLRTLHIFESNEQNILPLCDNCADGFNFLTTEQASEFDNIKDNDQLYSVLQIRFEQSLRLQCLQ